MIYLTYNFQNYINTLSLWSIFTQITLTHLNLSLRSVPEPELKARQVT